MNPQGPIMVISHSPTGQKYLECIPEGLCELPVAPQLKNSAITLICPVNRDYFCLSGKQSISWFYSYLPLIPAKISGLGLLIFHCLKEHVLELSILLPWVPFLLKVKVCPIV